MRLCLEIVDNESCKCKCVVSGKENPDCANCTAYKEIENRDSRITKLNQTVLLYKDKADKYDEILKIYSEELTKTILRTFLNTL